MNATDSIFTEIPKIHKGHTLFEVNHVSKEVVAVPVFEQDGKLKICLAPGCEYVAALNIRNAIKKYNKEK